MRYVFVLTVFLFVAANLYPEYRVYELQIDQVLPGAENENSVKTYNVVSTLDDMQYLRYYGRGTSMRARIFKTWMCGGDTSKFKKLCTYENRTKD